MLENARKIIPKWKVYDCFNHIIINQPETIMFLALWMKQSIIITNITTANIIIIMITHITNMMDLSFSFASLQPAR